VNYTEETDLQRA